MIISSKNQGFSLIETLITLIVISIILSFTIPYFHQQMAKLESNKIQNLLFSSIHLAKSNASIRRNNIVICSSIDNIKCQKNAWNSGILIFIDTNNNKQLDAEEQLIIHNASQLKYGNLESRGTLSSPSISFLAKHDGLPIGNNGSFYYCSNYDLPNKRIALSKMGHVRIEDSKNC